MVLQVHEGFFERAIFNVVSKPCKGGRGLDRTGPKYWATVDNQPMA